MPPATAFLRIHGRLLAVALPAVLGLTLTQPSAACDRSKSANATAGATCSSSCPASMCSGKSAANHSAACSAACKAAAATIASKTSATSSDAAVSKSVTAATAATASHPHRARAARAHHKTHVKHEATTAAAVSTRGAGVIAVIDPETGHLTQPTADQMRAFAEAARAQTPTGTLRAQSEPQVVTLANGAKLVRLGDRFDQFATAHVDANGRVHLDCSHDPGATAQATTPAPVMSTTPAVEK